MSEFGRVVYVEERAAGTQLVGAHSSGVTVLNVADVGGLPESGSVLVGADTLAYTAIADTDDEVSTTDTITLAAPTPSAYTDRQQVTVTPTRLYKVAIVALPDSSTVEVRVPHKLHDRLAEGPREDDAGEVVSLVTKPLIGLVLDDMFERPKVIADYLDPESTAPAGPIRNAFTADPDGMAATIPAASIAPGTLPPSVTVGGLVHDDQGTRMLNPDGSAAFDVPTDGRPARTSGLGDFDRIATRSAQLAGATDVVGTIHLRSTVTPPPIAPGGALSWATVDVAFDVTARSLLGRADKSSTEAYTLSIRQDGTPRLVVFNPTAGTQTAKVNLSGAPTDATIYSLAYSSLVDRVSTLEWDAAARQWLVRYYHYTGTACTYDSQWTWAEGGSVESPRPAFAMLGFGGHEYTRIARSNSDGTVTVREYADHVIDPTHTGTTPVLNLGDLAVCAYYGGTVVLSGVVNPTYPAGMPFPAGWVGLYPNRPAMPVVNVNFVGSPGDVLGWCVVGNRDTQPAGAAVLDGDPSQQLRYLSGTTQQSIAHSALFEAGKYDTVARWYNSTTGAYSDVGPVTTLDKIPGSIVTVNVAPPPSGIPADSIQVFMGLHGGTLYLQGASTPGTYSLPVFSIATSGTTPGAGTMTSSTPAQILSESGAVLVDATGYVAGGGGSGGTDDTIYADEMTGDLYIVAT